MSIVNRDLNPSEQKIAVYFRSVTGMITGATFVIGGPVPYPCEVQSVRSFALGVSTAAQLTFQTLRFAGGQTVISQSISNMVLNNFGTSGIVGYSGLAVPGSTLVQLQAGDMLACQMSVTNGACTDLMLNIVLKKLQDIVSFNGISS